MRAVSGQQAVAVCFSPGHPAWRKVFDVCRVGDYTTNDKFMSSQLMAKIVMSDLELAYQN